MRTALAALVCMGMVGACERPTQKPSSSSHNVVRADASEQSAPDSQRSSAQGSASQVVTEALATMTEYIAHLDTVVAIMREHGKECDLAAKQLDARVSIAVVLDLALRITKLKEALEALPEQERERVSREGDRAMEAFKARNPDLEAIMQATNACMKTSPAFAEVSPKGLFGRRTKK